MFGQPWWLLTLAALGLLTLVSASITLFSSLGRRPARVRATALPSVHSPDFLAALAGALNT
ncbi:MAG: hypothetical protein ACRENP_28800, partial [Longimicrobiales bacterium]